MKKILLFLGLFLLMPFAAAQARDLPDFTELVEAQGATVVNISTTQPVRGSRSQYGPFGRLPFDENDPAFEFFRRFFPPGQDDVFPGLQTRSLGSGFIISPDGHILTNAHVVDGASEILVKLADKRELRARLLGADARTDIALIKIDALGLPVVKLGDPARLKVGEWVIAIGSPFGFENSVTAGIVSAKSRVLPQESFVPFIQTDAAINPGNSGGPLFNMRGEVVGVNSQIYSRSGGYMGLAFAVPIDVAMEVQAQLKSHGRVVRGRIGVVMRDVSKELADSFGLIKAQGVLIDAVERDGPADRGGIVPGDVVLRMNGELVRQSSDLQRMIGSSKPGSRVVLQVWRKGAMQDFIVNVAETLDGRALAAASARAGKPAEPRGQSENESENENGNVSAMDNRLGLRLAELSAAQRKRLRASGGILVVDAQGIAAAAGLRRGDIILALIVKGAQTDVRSVEQFNVSVEQIGKAATLTLRVMRGESQTFVSIKGHNENKW
ncbi:Do family serine endopeptidase [Sterolibacterium denitrificans]|nr:Do family serine endopeptidase [Sterolibacterium denitrificans]